MNIRTLCLGLLSAREATGYEINKLVSEGQFSHFIEASYGSIYPALTRLTEEGLVTWREEAQAGKPSRKVYEITEQGRSAFADLIQETPKPDLFKSEFLFTCLNAGFLPPGHLRLVLEGQIEHLRAGIEHLHEAKTMCDQPGTHFAIGYGLAMKQALLNYLQENFDRAVETELRAKDETDPDCSLGHSTTAEPALTAK